MKALKWGCIGCGSIFVLLCLFVGGMFGLGWMQAKNVKPEEVRWEAAPITENNPASSSGETSENAPDPTNEGMQTQNAISVPTGILKLDIERAKFYLNPIDAGSVLSVEGAFDPKFYRLTHEESTDDEGNVIVDVQFRGTTSGFASMIRQLFTKRPTLTVNVPMDAFGKLEYEGSDGEGWIDLTGLQLENVELSYAQGAVFIDIDEPTPIAYQSFRVSGSQGFIRVINLGNASPRVSDFSQSMGAIEVNALGEWRNDGEISLSTSMGSGVLTVPEDVVVEGTSELSLGVDPNPEIPLPVLSIDTSSFNGEIQIRQR